MSKLEKTQNRCFCFGCCTSTKNFSESLVFSRYLINTVAIYPIRRDFKEETDANLIGDVRILFFSLQSLMVKKFDNNIFQHVSMKEDKFTKMQKDHPKVFLLLSFEDFKMKYKEIYSKNFKYPSNNRNTICDSCYVLFKLLQSLKGMNKTLIEINKKKIIIEITKDNNSLSSYTYEFILKKSDGTPLKANEEKFTFCVKNPQKLLDNERKRAIRQLERVRLYTEGFLNLISSRFSGHEFEIQISSLVLRRYSIGRSFENGMSEIKKENKESELLDNTKITGLKVYSCVTRSCYERIELLLRDCILKLPKIGVVYKTKKIIDKTFCSSYVKCITNGKDYGLWIPPDRILFSIMRDREKMREIIKHSFHNSRAVEVRNHFIRKVFPEIEPLRSYCLITDKEIKFSGKEFKNYLFVNILLGEGPDESCCVSDISKNDYLAMVNRFTIFDSPDSQKPDNNIIQYLIGYKEDDPMDDSRFHKILGFSKHAEEIEKQENFVYSFIYNKEEFFLTGIEVEGTTLVQCSFKFLLRMDEAQYKQNKIPNLSSQTNENATSSISISTRIELRPKNKDRFKLISENPSEIFNDDSSNIPKKGKDLWFNYSFINDVFLSLKKPEELFSFSKLSNTIYSPLNIYRIIYDVLVHQKKRLSSNHFKFSLFMEQRMRNTFTSRKKKNEFSNVFFLVLKEFGFVSKSIFDVDENGEFKLNRTKYHSKKESIMNLSGGDSDKFLGIKKVRNLIFHERLIEELKSFKKSEERSIQSDDDDDEEKTTRMKNFSTLLEVMEGWFEKLIFVEQEIWKIIKKNEIITDRECLLIIPKLLDMSTIIQSRQSPFIKSMPRYLIYRNYPYCMLVMIILLGQLGGAGMSGVEFMMGGPGLKGNFQNSMKFRDTKKFRDIVFDDAFDPTEFSLNNKWLNCCYTLLSQDVMSNSFLSTVYFNDFSNQSLKKTHIEDIPMQIREYLKEMKKPEFNVDAEDIDEIKKMVKGCKGKTEIELLEFENEVSRIFSPLDEVTRIQTNRKTRLLFSEQLPEKVQESLKFNDSQTQLDHFMKIKNDENESNNSSKLLLASPGYGKTRPKKVAAISFCHSEPGNVSVISAPSHVVAQWIGRIETYIEDHDLVEVNVMRYESSQTMKTKKFARKVEKFLSSGGILCCNHQFWLVVSRNRNIFCVNRLYETMMKSEKTALFIDESHLFTSDTTYSFAIKSESTRRFLFTGSAIVNVGKTTFRMIEMTFKKKEEHEKEVEELEEYFNELEVLGKGKDGGIDFAKMNICATKIKKIITKGRISKDISIHMNELFFNGISKKEYVVKVGISDLQRNKILQTHDEVEEQWTIKNPMIKLNRLSHIFISPFLFGKEEDKKGKKKKFSFSGKIPPNAYQNSPKLKFIMNYVKECFKMGEKILYNNNNDDGGDNENPKNIVHFKILIGTKKRVCSRFIHQYLLDLDTRGYFDGKKKKYKNNNNNNNEEEEIEGEGESEGEEEEGEDAEFSNERIILIHGGIKPKKRSKMIKNFNNNNSFQVLVFTIDSCGNGVDMQTANRLIICDLPWTGAKSTQVTARIWRKGQKRNCEVITLVCDDAELQAMKVVTLKTSLHRSIFCSQEVTNCESIMNDDSWMNNVIVRNSVFTNPEIIKIVEIKGIEEAWEGNSDEEEIEEIEEEFELRKRSEENSEMKDEEELEEIEDQELRKRSEQISDLISKNEANTNNDLGDSTVLRVAFSIENDYIERIVPMKSIMDELYKKELHVNNKRKRDDFDDFDDDEIDDNDDLDLFDDNNDDNQHMEVDDDDMELDDEDKKRRKRRKIEEKVL